MIFSDVILRIFTKIRISINFFSLKSSTYKSVEFMKKQIGSKEIIPKITLLLALYKPFYIEFCFDDGLIYQFLLNFNLNYLN